MRPKNKTYEPLTYQKPQDIAKGLKKTRSRGKIYVIKLASWPLASSCALSRTRSSWRLCEKPNASTHFCFMVQYTGNSCNQMLLYRKGGNAMRKAKKRCAVIFAAINGAVILFTVAFCLFFKPWRLTYTNAASTCIFQNLFHLYCPACGGTRAVGYLLRFDLAKAFLCYPPLFLFIALLIRVDVLLARCFFKGDDSALREARFYEFISIPAVVFLWFLIRNLLLFFGIDPLGDIIAQASFAVFDFLKSPAKTSF